MAMFQGSAHYGLQRCALLCEAASRMENGHDTGDMPHERVLLERSMVNQRMTATPSGAPAMRLLASPGVDAERGVL